MEYKQIVEPESQETNINIDYFGKKIVISTSKSTVMNRLTSRGYKPSQVSRLKDEVCSMSFEFGFEDMRKFVTSSLFKCQ